jgi:allantoinase
MESLVVRSERVVLPDGVRPASVHIANGRIATIAAYADVPGGVRLLDAGPHMLLPGLVDTHVHINDPGRAEWEGFEHATKSAAAGGVTTLVDMPLNSIPSTTDVRAFEAKREAAKGGCHVDVGFWGGVVPGNVDSLEPLARAGVLGFKCFLCPSGVDEFEHVTEKDLRAALPVLSKLPLPLLAHSELPALLNDGAAGDPRRYATWLESRPPASELAAIDLLIRLAREFDAAVHIVHLASRDALPSLQAARMAGAKVTIETCPHYLTFAGEDIPDGATSFKCAPPIRSREHREGLWQGLADGVIDLVATDHSPAPPSMKRLDTGDFMRAWGGIASLQIGLSAVWTGASARGFSIEDVVRWMCREPARLAGLEARKGAIAPGKDADLIVWDPDAESTVDPAALYHRHPVTPYAGLRLRGRVVTTLVRGQAVVREGQGAAEPFGQVLLSLR